MARPFATLKNDLSIGVTVPSCPSELVPFILQNHQLYSAKYLSEIKHEPINSLLLWHGLGSGKTLSSIAAAFEMPPNSKVMVACQASLMENYQDELLSDYATKVNEFLVMPYIGLAIDIANKFIAECKRSGLNDHWIKPFIAKLLIKVGNTGDITNFSNADITRIVNSRTENVFDVSLTGGRTRRHKKNKRTRRRPTRKQRGGEYKRSMTEHGINFIFKSTNGVLNSDGFGNLADVSLIIIDESQLLISQLRQDYSHVNLFSNGKAFFGRPDNAFITMDEFESTIDRSSGIGRIRAYKLYNELLHRPPTTQLLLLSATPIIKNPYEIAIAVNILSRQEVMPINERVFEHNYGHLTKYAPYDYSMTNDVRKWNIAGRIHTPIKNEDYFKQVCSGCVSFFGNVTEMLPTLNLLGSTTNKYVYNNSGTPFISIIECPLYRQQIILMKYLQFVCDPENGGLGHTQFATLKNAFMDCAFRLDDPGVFRIDDPSTKFVPASSTNMANGFRSGRAEQVANITVRFTHSFQSFLDQNIEAVAIKVAESFVKPPPKKPVKTVPASLQLSAEETLIPIITLEDIMENTKIRPLIENITSDYTQRHVIYITSRYVSILVGRILTESGFLEIKSSDGSSLSAAAESTTPFPKENSMYFAFLRGELEDDKDPVTMLKYTENDGNSKNKADVIKLFKNPANDNRFKILIINNCVAEGITLPRVNKIHIFSLPYDIAKLQQIVARVYRNCVHPPGGSVTPLLYLTTGDSSSITREMYLTLYPTNSEWQTYANKIPLEPDAEKKKLVEKIVENDRLLPYYRIFEQCSIETMAVQPRPLPPGPPPGP
jgi:hypothetical protein